MSGGVLSLPLLTELGLTRMLALAGASLVLAGCRSIGPATVARDRFDYVASMSAPQWQPPG
jgi:hypothetical protein